MGNRALILRSKDKRAQAKATTMEWVLIYRRTNSITLGSAAARHTLIVIRWFLWRGALSEATRKRRLPRLYSENLLVC